MNKEDESNSASVGELIKCPCCGKLTLKKPIRPGGDLLDSWLACSATGTRFTHVYPLYSGRVTVTAASMDDAALLRLRKVSAAIDRLVSDDRFSALGEPELRETESAIRLFMCITEIAFDKPVPRVYDTAAACSEAVDLLLGAVEALDRGESADGQVIAAHAAVTCSDRISALPTGMLAAVYQTHSQFTDIMASAGFDEDFWRGIELA